MLPLGNWKALVPSQVVTKTFHGAGIVVPVDKNDVGYRELPETDGELRHILNSDVYYYGVFARFLLILYIIISLLIIQFWIWAQSLI